MTDESSCYSDTARTDIWCDRQIEPAERFDIVDHARMDRGHSNEPDAEPARRKIAGLSDWQKNKIARYIDDHIDSCLRVEHLGRQVRLSGSRFSKGFRESFGRSPYDYVLLRRVEAAKFLISTTGEPLSQIAQACGLSDQAHLTKVFRRFVGMPPLRWRQATACTQAPSHLPDAHRWRRLCR